ncbi:MMPL family transporter [uncultured Amnibacterium sp.]|uniref:MMPL family transporter n=1 Tax=uncultured Amnibacterium sp. TaxID=1631851 RepID=UPI0035C9A70C
MSSLLYSLGRWSFRNRRRVLAIWILVVVLAGGVMGVLSRGTDSVITIPGTESQNALDALANTFPEVSGGSAQVVVVAAKGRHVTDSAYRSGIAAELNNVERITGVDAAGSPYDTTVKGAISDDRTAAVISVQLTEDSSHVTDTTREDLLATKAAFLRQLPAGTTVAVGGSVFATQDSGGSITDTIGVLVAFFVLFFVFRSFLAAGMPLLAAVLGVGVSTLLIYAATVFGGVSSTAPALALMLGLAVGIDYSLFLISRYQELLRGGLSPDDAAPQATATAGSAVVFAGITVVIALVGLSIAGIPFLTVMGIAAAGAVALSVTIALSLTPALLGFAGSRLYPSRRTVARAARRNAKPRRNRGERVGLAFRWVRAITRFPIVTVLAVIVALGALATPVLTMQLGIPDAGSKPTSTQARRAYDLISNHFGPGVNGPLLVTGTIVQSDDPVTLVNRIGAEIRAMPGVQSVPLATPNRTADTGIIQVVPTTGPNDPATAKLITAIRAQHDHFEDEYGVDLSVTGAAAVGIDISDKLGGALLPFGGFVVGLSFILLMIVFRSIAVPIKATLGYLLSVVAAFGVVSAVFVHGVGADLIGATPGIVISFLPILLMGILFGLAMDYELFLVSRIREEYVHSSGDAHAAIERGFVGSSKVVTAAAAIMFSVFVSFVPGGEGAIQQVGVGLAAGVVIDAFIVRMTLVPAVLALLGRNAWWLPKWLDRLLPDLDVEGEAIRHELNLAGWPAQDMAIAARGLRLDGVHEPVFSGVDVQVPWGGAFVVESSDPARATALLLTLAGRIKPDAGDLKVVGDVLPNRAGAARRRIGLAMLAGSDDPLEAVRQAFGPRSRVVVIDGLDTVIDAEVRTAIAELIETATTRTRSGGAPLTLVVSTTPGYQILELLPPGPQPVTRLAVAGSASPARTLKAVTSR